MTISIDRQWAVAVRRSAEGHPGGVSGYLERVIRDHEMRRAVRRLGAWYAQHPEVVVADVAEIEAAEAERAELGLP
ncbi:MAG: hypothetical protein JO100_05115 [Pseudonocardia sp.]|nr:hypothetical protein [Pseudonocardia sp.]